MSVQQEQMTLSRFFNNNVQLVAKMCHRCYEEEEEVKILSVNLPFLQKASNDFEDVDIKTLEMIQHAYQNFINLEEDEDDFRGFGEEEIDKSQERYEKLRKAFETKEKSMQNFKTSDNIDEESFFGFSSEDINQSMYYYKKFKKVSKLITCKTYKRLKLKAMKGLGSHTMRERHRKTRRRKSNSTQGSNISKYFKCEPINQESDSLKAKVTPVKQEDVDVKLEECEHIKPDQIKAEPEMLDYESKYFADLKPHEFMKPEEHWAPKKEGFEDCIPEEKPSLWVPPRSPHNLIEEVLYHDPWAVLVATIFLNRTRCMCARPYVFWFLSENPSPLKVLDRFPADLEKYFVKLGLQRTRAVQVWRMSHDFVHKNWRKVTELYGIGKYGEDAFKMFCQGDFNVQPKDRFLKIYKAWYERILLGLAREDGTVLRGQN